MKRRIVALLMALSLLASVCVFTANADDPAGIVVNSAEELIEALKTENAQITLGSDIVLNEGITFEYDEANAVIIVSDANGTIAKVRTGEAAGTTPGSVAEGSLSGLTKWAPLPNLNGADIDGNGYTIKGLYINGDATSGGAFVKEISVGSSVKNLNFENSLVITSYVTRPATLTSLLYGEVYDISFENAYVIGSPVQANYVAGGAIGLMSTSTSGTTATYSPVADGISFNGGVFAKPPSDTGNLSIGGVIGQNKGGTVKNCENYATVKLVGGVTYAAGGVIGLLEPVDQSAYGANGAPRDAFIYNNANYGKIVSNKADASYAGGVIGRIDVYWSAYEDVMIHNLYNAGEVVNGKEVIGYMNNGGANSPIDKTMLHYCFAPETATGEVLTPSTSFSQDVISIAKDTNAKILSFLNHGATAYEGLKTWEEVGGVLKMTDTDATYDANFVAKDITSSEPTGPDYTTPDDGVKIVSVKVLDEFKLEVTFSEPVKKTGNVWRGIRYITKDFGLQKDPETNEVIQYFGGVAMNETDATKATITFSTTGLGGKSLYDVLTKKGYEDLDCYVAFGFEGMDTAETKIVGYVDNFASVADPTKLLGANKPSADGFSDGIYAPITDIENANPGPDYTTTDGGIKIESVKALNSTQLEITFSDEVTTQGNYFNGIRYTDADFKLMKDGDTYLQFTGNITYSGNKATFTYNTASGGGKSLYDVLLMKGYEDKGYFLSFAYEGHKITDFEDSDYQTGYIDNIVSATDPDKRLATNKPNGHIYEACYAPITDIENAKPEPAGPSDPPDYTTPDDGVKIVSAKVIDEFNIEITFSEPVKRTGNVWRGIRYITKNYGLQKDPATNSIIQYFGGVTINEADATKATISFSASSLGGKSLYDVLTKKGYEDLDCYVVCGFEGMETLGDDHTYVVGYVDNFASIADPTKYLGANKPSTDGIYDGVYAPITDIENAVPAKTPDYTTTDGGIKIESVKALNSTQLEITFSDEVIAQGNYFNGIRYTDADFKLMKDGDTYLQFTGNITYSGNKATFTYSPASNGGKSLYDVLLMKGYESKGYFLSFAYEGHKITDFEDSDYQTGYIDNIVSATDPDKRLATNLPNGHIYEACYAPITDIDKAMPAPVDPSDPPDYTTPDDGIKIESVKVLNETEFEVTFSDPIKVTGNFWRGIRYIDNKLSLKTDGGVHLQHYMTNYKVDGNKILFTYDPSANGGKTLYDMLTLKGYEDKGYFVAFCIEGLASSYITAPVVGYVDNISSADDPTKLLGANKPEPSGAVFDGCYAPFEDIDNAIPPEPGENPGEPTVDMTPTENGITIESAKVINETQIEITFSEPVKKVGSVFAAIRYTNSALKLAQDLALEDKNLQFYGSLTFNDTNKAIYTFTPSDNRCLYDILTRRGYENKNYYVYFCIEGLPSTYIEAPIHGYIDNVQSLDGTKLLASNKPSADGKGLYDGYYIEITDGALSLPDDYVKRPFYDVEALSATLLNEREIEITFSEPVTILGNVFNGIRYVDENNNLRYDGSTPLQFETSIRFNNSRKMIVTLKDTNTLTMEEILAFKGYEDKGYKVAICLEGLGSSYITEPIKGYIDNIQTYDGRGMLLANKVTSVASDKIYDGIYLEIQNQENATVEFTEATPLPAPEIPVIPIDPDILVVPEDSLKVVSVQVMNSTQIKVVFSESVETVGFFFRGIRYVNRTLGLRTDNGKYLQWDFGTPLIEGNTMIFQWGKEDISMADVLNLKGYEQSGYYVMFCFEGYTNSAIPSYKVGYIDNIKGTKRGKLLGANKSSPDGIYDGLYCNITGLENLTIRGPKPGEVPIKNRPNFTLVSAKVINPSQIELIFSEPVKRQSNVFAAVRYTDKDMKVQLDKSLAAPHLQFHGNITFDSTERAVWTMSSSFDKTLYEILNFKGYEKSGYYLYFCLEGLPNATAGNEPGYIDNIQSLDGKKKLKCTPARAEKGGVYDGLYIKIENIEKAKPIEVPDLEGIFVDQIEALSNYQLELQFTEPVYVVGMGNEATQFNALKASVRYVDPVTFEVVTYNNLLMEFGADIYIEDGSTIGIFELRSQDKTLKQLFDMEGYEDLMEKAIPVLSLEGTEDMKLIPLAYPGYVDNIQNADGTNFLTAMIADQMGVYDAWIATADEIKFEIRKTEIEQLKEILSINAMTSEQIEALNAMDEAELKETLTKAKELIEGLKSGEMTEAGVEAFNALLKKNGIDNAEKVKAMMFTVGETFNIGFPTLLNFDVSEREYSAADTVYVYRVNADGSVTEIAQKELTVYVADEIITRVEFADSIIGDYFVTNSRLELPQPFNPIVIAYIAIGVMVLAIVALVIFLLAKKKKEKNA